MFSIRSGLTVLWLALALIALSACQETQRMDTRGGTQRVKPIAVVNNEPLALEDFLDRYKLFLTQWDRFIKNDPKKKQEIKVLVLEEMIEEKLLDQEARRRGIQVDPEEAKQRMAALTSPLNEAEMNQSIQRSGKEFDLWRGKLIQRIVHEKLIKKEIVTRIKISRQEMRAYYESNKNQFIQMEQVRVRHIAVSSRKDYNKVQRDLRRSVDFVQLVRKYSITPDREADGDLGYVERGVLPVEFDQAIFSMKQIGSISPANPPVKTQIGYHIFRLEGRKPRVQLSFENALSRIRESLVAQKQPEVYKKWVEELRSRATISIDKNLLEAELG